MDSQQKYDAKCLQRAAERIRALEDNVSALEQEISRLQNEAAESEYRIKYSRSESLWIFSLLFLGSATSAYPGELLILPWIKNTFFTFGGISSVILLAHIFSAPARAIISLFRNRRKKLIPGAQASRDCPHLYGLDQTEIRSANIIPKFSSKF